MSDILLKPIGIIKSAPEDRRAVARQASLETSNNNSYIELTVENSPQCLIGLEGFSHLWVIFAFHLNSNWKPMIQPPRLDHKVGVFATRSPHRPNPIGMSLCEIKFIKNNRVYLGANDLLEGTPILDLKPYLHAYDSTELSKNGWLDSLEGRHYVTFTDEAELQAKQYSDEVNFDFKELICRQLEYHPTDKQRKRVKAIDANHWVLSYQLWRIEFSIHEQNHVKVLTISKQTLSEI